MRTTEKYILLSEGIFEEFLSGTHNSDWAGSPDADNVALFDTESVTQWYEVTLKQDAPSADNLGAKKKAGGSQVLARKASLR